MKLLRLSLLAMCVAAIAARADAGTLFASSAAGGPGELYILNQATGAVLQDIGPLNDVTGGNYPITGLAFHPTTGVLYGSTGNSEAGKEAILVSINPATALVTVIGTFDAGPVNSSGKPATMADLAFDSAGNLYGVGSIGGPQLYSINTATAKATVIGSTGLTSTSGGGLGISPASEYFGSPTSTRFGTYNSVTGAFTNIVAPTRPVGGAYAALAFDGSVLYGLNLGSTPTDTRLVIFDKVTGAISELGASAANLDAIAFQIPEPATQILLTIGLTSLVGRRRR
jgi:hypothetical protein